MWTHEHRRRHDELRLLKESLRDQHLGRNGVIGLSVGFKTVGGRKTSELVIRFHVRRKGQVPEAHVVPREIEGVKTDVVETDVQLDVWPPLDDRYGVPEDNSRYLSLIGGIGVGRGRGSGTLGLVVTDNIFNEPMILSNFHVLCELDGSHNYNDPISQPDRTERWRRLPATCARLQRWAPPDVVWNADGRHYGVDAAIAYVSTMLRRVSRDTVRQIGQVACTDGGFATNIALNVGDLVRKRGRTTGLTTGTVDSTTLDIQYPRDFLGQRPWFYNQIQIEMTHGVFAYHGDSGAVYVAANPQTNAWMEVVGIHWSSQGKIAIGSPIMPVLQALNVRIAPMRDPRGP